MSGLSILAGAMALSELDALKGKKILACSISDNREEVTLDTDDGPYRLLAEGDCCSSSWIEHFDPAPLVGGTITAIEMKDLPDPEHDGDLMPTKYPDFQQEVDLVYFYEIRTDRASETIEMRNSSNGYYGGWLSLSRVQP